VIRSWLEKLEAEVEIHRRESPGSSQTNQSSDGLKAHTCNLGTCRAVSSGYRKRWREDTRWAWNRPHPEEPERLLASRWYSTEWPWRDKERSSRRRTGGCGPNIRQGEEGETQLKIL
jgi:hypothetical protein